ncbi:MAG: Amylo-alpha-16-glucosidase, partial [Chloroflexi bacterium]|nr:Amylo-alpha-16-glucosidase [Chloroflexota bacterium]
MLKENEIFAVTDRDGNIHAQSADGQGLYFRDTRFLSVYDFSIDNLGLQLLSSAGELNFMSNLQFGNLAGAPDGNRQVPARTVSIRRNRFIDNGLHERIGLLNLNPFPLRLSLRLTFGSDFRDMFDVRGYAPRARRGVVHRPEPHEEHITLRYVGVDNVERTTEVGFDRLPDSVEAVSTTSSPQRTTPWNIGSGTGDPREELGMQPPLVQAVYHVDL